MMTVIGPTGSGKNNFVNLLLLSAILAGNAWIVAFFPHPQPAIQLIAEAYAVLGDALIPRLIVERLSDTDRVLMRSIVRRTAEANHFARNLANDRSLNWFLEMLAYGRPDFKNPTSRPVLYRFTSLAYRALQYAAAWMPDSWMPLVLRPRHPVQEQAIATCTHPEVRGELEWIRTLPLREQLALLQPVQNMLTPFIGNAVSDPRSSRPPRFDKREFLRRGGIHILIADNIPLEAQRLAFALDFEETMIAAGQGVGRPGFYVVDELNKLGVTESYVTRLATMRASDVTIIGIQQWLSFETPEQSEGHCQNTDHYWTPQASERMAELAARDMRGLLDRFAVHHFDETVRQFNQIELVDRESVTETSGPHGSSKSKSKSVVPVSIPQFIVERRPVYESPKDQEFWNVARIMQAPVGTVFVKPRMGPPRVEQVPLFPNTWGFPEVMRARFEECLAKCMQNPIFETPVVNGFPVPASPTTPTRQNGRRRRSR